MAQLQPPVQSNDHSSSGSKATVELVEYGDYQCPYCGIAYPIIKNIQKKLGDDLKFVFRNFPLSEIHPDAFSAAVAAEAAGMQEKYWDMHDIIYEHQHALNAEHLFQYAKTIGLDMNQFKEDIQKDELSAKVEQDFESGIRSGVNGTPSFFINGRKYNDDYEEHTLLRHLKEQIHGSAANE